MLDDVNEAGAEVENVDIECILRLLYRVRVLVNVLVLDIEFRQLMEVIEFKLLSSDQLLRVLVGDAPRSCCGSDRRSGDP